MTIAFSWANQSQNVGPANAATSIVVGSTNAQGANGTINQNDLLIACVVATGAGVSGTITQPGGWTQIYNNFDASQNRPMITSVWVKIAGASETGNYTFSWTGTSVGCSWALLDYTGVSTGAPVDASAGQNNDSFSTNMTAPSISPAGAADMMVCVWAEDGGNATYAPAAGMTQRSTTGGTGNGSTSSDRPEILIAELQLSASGATGTKVGTCASAPTVGVSMALTPAGGAAAVPWLPNEFGPAPAFYRDIGFCSRDVMPAREPRWPPQASARPIPLPDKRVLRARAA